MKKLFYYTEILIIIIIVWIILNERFGIIEVISGLFIGILAIEFTDYYLLLGDYKNSYQIHPTRILKYVVFLIVEIYASGVSSIILMINGKTNVGIVEFQTELDNELYICLLANAITLTPGTVTLDKSGSVLKVLCLNCPENKVMDNKVGSIFEAILMGR